MSTVFRVLATFIFVIVSFNTALAVDWVANNVRQPAQYSMDGKSWTNIKVGLVIPSSSWVQTGKRGRLVLNRGKELIQFKPNTMASISKANSSGSKTLVKQRFGSLLLDVETKNHKHFKVETPYLAAVVKGTRFIVDVVGTSSRLSVLRGVVEVTDEKRGERVDVHSLQTVKVNQNANQTIRVNGVGKKSKVVKVKAKEPNLKSILNIKSSGKFSNIYGPKKSFLDNLKKNIQTQREKFEQQYKTLNSKNSSFGNAFGRSKSNSSNTNAANKSDQSSNSNAGRNANGNSGNSNAGGNTNGNSGNSNAGGNANSNSSNSNSNAGGNGNGNSGNSNSGNSNAGGNGNGNS